MQPTYATTAGAGKDPRTNTSLYTLLATFFIFFFFILFLSITYSPRHLPPSPDPFLFPNHHTPTDPHQPPTPPSIAYLISGSSKDSPRILRLLFSIYHPRNHYLLHLDRNAPQSERDSLALTVHSVPVFKAAQNVNVIGKSNFAYPKGSSPLSSVLHGAAILLRISKNWDWFINLSANDYPLVTQDDLLHILSYLPRGFNFVNHTSHLGWRETRRLRPIIVDPGLYLSENDEVYYGTQKRELPDAFQLFTGSSSAILSRKFIDFCILGTENLPRTLLMYLSNAPSSQSFYFPTILCNSNQFKWTTINHNLQYASYDTRQLPRLLNSSDFNDLVKSGLAFAYSVKPDDPVLNRIDREILHRGHDKPVPGGWCLGESGNEACTIWGDADVLRPGPGARRLEKHIVHLFSNNTFWSSTCI